jgi:hypothetical protein
MHGLGKSNLADRQVHSSIQTQLVWNLIIALSREVAKVMQFIVAHTRHLPVEETIHLSFGFTILDFQLAGLIMTC